jgi:hypothetical protein
LVVIGSLTSSVLPQPEKSSSVPGSHGARDLLEQTGKGTAAGDARARRAGEAAHVQLVDDRVGKRTLERPVAFPVVLGRFDHRPAQRGGDIVASGARRCAAPARGHDAPRVRVEEHLLSSGYRQATSPPPHP